MLPATLEHAVAHAPYYRRAFGQTWKRVRRVAELPLLPLLDKATAIAQQRALITTKKRAFTGIISSGTHASHGRLLRVPRVEEEARALDALERSLPRGGADGWVLEVRNVHHGLVDGTGRPGRLAVPWTYSAQALRLIEEMLSRPHGDGRRVTSMVIGAGAVMPLTAWLLSKHVDPSSFGVELIGTNSFRLSPHWKELVGEAFGARVLDNYSLSEVPTPALECISCGFNHWLLPPVAFEVLDPFTREPLEDGMGVLTVTTLYPYVQAMPLLRYWTGDLVELGPFCDVVQDRGIRFRGRLDQSLLSRRHGILVAAQDVIDVVESSPLTARHPHPMETLGLVPGTECGAGKVELTLSNARKPAPKVRVELRCDPKIFSKQAHEFGESLANHLLSASPALRRLEKRGEGELEVELCAPGTLQKEWVKF